MQPGRPRNGRHGAAFLASVVAGFLSFAPGALAVPQLPDINTNNVLTITDPPFNAVGDGMTDNTLAISNAIVLASQGGNTNNLYGGTVRIPGPGAFLSGPLTLRNNVDVQIDAGATLQMLPLNLFTNYPPQNQTFGNLLYASGLTNLEISGSGTIDGQGSNWWSAPGSIFSGRPYMLFFNGNCGRVLIQNVTLQNPPKMHIVFKGSDNNITVQGITINTTATNAANTDGIDLVGSNCLVQNCVINAGDDNIALGSSSASAVSSDIVITNCAFGKGHGVSIGSNTAGGVSNLTVIDCTFKGTDYGIRMKSNDATSGGSGQGGIAQNLNYYNIGMTNIGFGAIVIYSYYGSSGEFGTPTTVSPYFASTQAVDVTTVPVWRDITISNVTATVTSNGVPGIIWARMEVPATNLVFNHVNISGSRPFDVYSAKGVQFIDCQITPPAGSNTFLIYNADVTISNSVPSANLVTFDGLSTNGYGSSLALHNAQASLANTNVFDTGLLTLDGSTLTVSNHLNLGASSVVNFVLGTNPATMTVQSNLALSGTVNLAAGGGFTGNTYTLFTYGGNLTWGPPVLTGTPGGVVYRFNTNTVGQVQVVSTIHTVSTTNDAGPGSLRQQIANAQSGDTIVFSNGLSGTITLVLGPLQVNSSLNILGPGPQGLSISGGGTSGVFALGSSFSSPLTNFLAGLTITDGNSDAGGGILNYGRLTISNCIIVDNQASTPSPFGTGGGIENNGPCRIINSTISGNVAATAGGGIENTLHAGTTLSLVNCTISSNLCSGVYGGGMDTASALNITNCTVADNQSTAAAGVGGIYCFGAAPILVAGSIVADNTSLGGESDVSGAGFTSAGFNLIGSTNGSTGFGLPGSQDLTGTAGSPFHPMLGPLQSNGGPTPTMALLFGSPAMDRGNSFGLTTDQRGAPRPFDFASIPNADGGDGSDIGAFESGSPNFRIGRFANSVILSWPAYYGNFTVQSSTNLASSGSWVSLPGSPTLVEDQLMVTNAILPGTRLYRLKSN
jgi:polygalacturonase